MLWNQNYVKIWLLHVLLSFYNFFRYYIKQFFIKFWNKGCARKDEIDAYFVSHLLFLHGMVL